ncbi:unnamed protein product [Rotaria sordida]|uniref:EF-hand domain-containing protein n=2 Tax=Rotaria sordida TaxID=392033 RepID=A0A813WFZ1_9BILA|nr:unnamed protein product [Rotaria sordida]CAF1336295.1 unnamed protein product [Rotaria sordida]
MFVEQQSSRSQPALAFSNTIPTRIENEVYIDGTSYVDGAPVNQEEHGRYNVTERQRKKSPFKQFLRFIRKLWATQQTEKFNDEEHNEKYVRTTIRELMIYMVFIGILTIVVFGMVSTNMYTLTQALKGVFVDSRMIDESTNNTGPSFSDISRMEEFWDYMTQIAAPALFTETWYNNDKVSNYGYILYENRLLGAVRMRQKKVRNNSCVVAKDFQQEIKFCYNSYAPAFEDKNSFGPCINLDAENCTEEPFRHTPINSIIRSSTTGKVGVYDQGGFIKILGSSQEEFKNEIEALKENLWITLGTRAILVDFTVYNANLNLFCQVQLMFEFPAVGGVVASSKFRAVKLIRYVNAFDYFVLSCEVIFLFFIIYYTIEEVLEVINVKSAYFKSVMNCLDMIVIILSYICMSFNIYRQVQVNNLLDQLLEKQTRQYSDFTFLCYWQYQFNNVISATIFLAWIKIFKYISFNKTMTQLSETLTKCAKDISGFAIMFFIIFFAFAQLGYLTFGIQIEGFRAFHYSVYTLFLVILGTFDFPALQQAHRVLGPLFFLTYVFFVFFVLLNMFLAIINDTYMEVKAELQHKKSGFEISDFVKQSYAKMRERLTAKHDRIADIRKALTVADINRDKRLDFEEWRNEMKSRGYAEEEIETMFAKYDTDGDRVLDEDEQQALTNDLLKQNDAILREMNELNMTTQNNKVMINAFDNDPKDNDTTSERLETQEVTVQEYNDLAKRLDSMESSVGLVLTKIDNMISRFEIYEKPKSNKDENKKNRPSDLKSITMNSVVDDSLSDSTHSMINIEF